jgi:hypothetical protein
MYVDAMYCWLWWRQMTDLFYCQRGRPTSAKPQLSDSNKSLVLSHRLGLTPRLTGRLTVGRNVSLTLKWLTLLPTWEYAADAHLLKLQRLQNRVHRALGNLDKLTPTHELHIVFKIPYTRWHN